MLDSARRSGLFLILLAVAAAPVASASIVDHDTVRSAEDQVSGLHPWAAWAVDQVPDRGSDGSGDGSGSGSSGGGSNDGSGSSSPGKDVVATTRPAVTLVLRKAAQVADQIPEDPLGLALEQIKPVRETAEGVTVIVLGENSVQPAGGAQPASASVVEVEPDVDMPLLVGATAAAAAAAVTLFWLAGSSGSLGAAGAAGSGGKLAATDLRRLLPFASPLFTRFEKDTVLGHPKREALYALILQDPGVSLQSLCDSTGLSRTAVTHHLRLMELQHLIVSKRMGRSRHYYENGGRFGRDQKDAYAVLQNDRSKEVAQFVKQNPGAIQKAICAAVGVQASVAHWHLRRLQEAQIVEAVRNGRTVSYFPGVGLKGMAPVVAAAAPAPAAIPALSA